MDKSLYFDKNFIIEQIKRGNYFLYLEVKKKYHITNTIQSIDSIANELEMYEKIEINKKKIKIPNIHIYDPRVFCVIFKKFISINWEEEKIEQPIEKPIEQPIEQIQKKLTEEQRKEKYKQECGKFFCEKLGYKKEDEFSFLKLFWDFQKLVAEEINNYFFPKILESYINGRYENVIKLTIKFYKLKSRSFYKQFQNYLLEFFDDFANRRSLYSPIKNFVDFLILDGIGILSFSVCLKYFISGILHYIQNNGAISGKIIIYFLISSRISSYFIEGISNEDEIARTINIIMGIKNWERDYSF